MIVSNNKKNICVSFYTVDEKWCEYENCFGEKSKNLWTFGMFKGFCTVFKWFGSKFCANSLPSVEILILTSKMFLCFDWMNRFPNLYKLLCLTFWVFKENIKMLISNISKLNSSVSPWAVYNFRSNILCWFYVACRCKSNL